MSLKYGISLIFAFVNRAYKNSDFYMVHYWNNTKMCRSKVKCNPCRIADLLPKHRNVQNLTPLYGFGAILGVFLRYERLYFDGCILTVRHSKVAVCRFRATKKRRISFFLIRMFSRIHLNLPIESANKNTQNSEMNSACFCLHFSSLKNGRKNGIINIHIL